MFDEEEEDYELLRQYENEEQEYTSDELESDVEDQILSMVQYGSGLNGTGHKQTTEATQSSAGKKDKVQVVVANDAAPKKSKNQIKPKSSDLLQLSSSEEDGEIVSDSDQDQDETADTEASDEENDSVEMELPQIQQQTGPRVTRYIDLDMVGGSRYMDDEDEESDEERELNQKLQNLIDDQIQHRQMRKRPPVIRLCHICLQPGHTRADCPLCYRCGASDHPGSDCPGHLLCNRCLRRGHLERDCYYEREDRPCKYCGLSTHCSMACPTLIHVYDEDPKATEKPVKPFCYCCGHQGHYGDDCKTLHYSLRPLHTVFSAMSMGNGTLDIKKVMKQSASSFGRHKETSRSHLRFSDSSSEQSEDRRESKRKKRKTKKKKDDGYEREDGRRLQEFFSNSSRESTPPVSRRDRPERASGKRNWQAINDSIPQPTRSGTLNIGDRLGNRQRYGNNYEANFPRREASQVPKPTSSGVISLPDISTQATRRGPRYNGGYQGARR
ncbi:uncharacterized protein BYT42DRAFT_281956 [Radiomyces spectabilis]|uniref:uncharacterized protein n=1 Tax=Radiomyces spectabilis TaxID=64574 RepID=UPI00221F85DF|nr:uncharacterized protein BYT42DRAFT_281956 [Radiomyces spectabilis]KAI8384979.1 hypothetical protein BYT42DRAFT_281956 [Radiomyces spectabilis]